MSGDDRDPLHDAALTPDELSRRRFLELLAISMATASATACKRAPDERALSHVEPSADVAPGVPRWYTTSIVEEGYAIGLLAESREGRPTKIEGNPRHPASLGGTFAHHQAWVLQLYDPARAQTIQRHGFPSSRRAFLEHLSTVAARAKGSRGRGLHVLVEPTSSAVLIDRIGRLRDALPEARVWFDGEGAPLAAWRAAEQVFGRVLEVGLDLSKAGVILDLDADVLASGERGLVHARAFGRRRKLRRPDETPPRLWVVEPALTPTGTLADARRSMRASEIGPFVAALLADVVDALGKDALPEPARAALTSVPRSDDAFRRGLSKALVEHGGRAAIAVGPGQPVEVHVLVHALRALVGREVTEHRASPIFEAGGASFGHDALVSALDGDAVEVLAVLSGNPSYTAPVDLGLADRISKAKERIVLGLHRDETGEASTWHVPAQHGLERWGEARAPDGTTSLVQPLIVPLVPAAITEAELLSWLLGELDFDAHRAVRTAIGPTLDPNGGWERALQRGLIEGTAFSPIAPTLDWDAVAKALDEASRVVPPGLEVVYPLDARTHDGRFANVAWLLELPDPITKVSWENVARVSPSTAKRLELSNEDVVELALDDRTLEVAVVVVPGDADDVITLSRGWGRRGQTEALARGLGVDANRIRTSRAPHHAIGVALRKTGRRHELALVQAHTSLDGRGEHVARARTLAEWRKDPEIGERHPKPTLYKLPLAGSPLGNQWAMVVDLSACTGCSACVVACQAENNVPTVGKTGVRMGREMHWLRIDTYVSGTPEEPLVIQQPMMCQHCEKAPCEYVCPVNATVHSPDGLNEQAYQRCIGTRFCSANCPYKVRRFNWFRYHHPSETQKLVYNPDVTVRERGVMEKCTFCVQRIRKTEVAARVARREVNDGDVRTACQQACPTEAIVFGSLTDPKAEVTAWHGGQRSFMALGELGTMPRVRYLTKIWDPPRADLDETAAPVPVPVPDEAKG